MTVRGAGPAPMPTRRNHQIAFACNYMTLRQCKKRKSPSWNAEGEKPILIILRQAEGYIPAMLWHTAEALPRLPRPQIRQLSNIYTIAI